MNWRKAVALLFGAVFAFLLVAFVIQPLVVWGLGYPEHMFRLVRADWRDPSTYLEIAGLAVLWLIGVFIQRGLKSVSEQ